MPTVDVDYVHPRNGGLSGTKIGLEGDTIWLIPDEMDIAFRQGVVKVDPVNANLLFFADREVVGNIVIKGDYVLPAGRTRNALGAMAKEASIGPVTIALDTGVTYVGYLVPLSDQNHWNKDGSEVQFQMGFMFSGQITGDGGSEDVDFLGSSGTEFLNVREVTGAASMEYRRSYADQREDYAVEPYAIVGINEGSGVPLSVAEANIVASMGGQDHKWRGNNTLPFHRITSRFAGTNLIVGELIYSRHALDCRAHQIEYDIGYVVRGSVGEVITGDSGSDVDNVCADLASGPFAQRFIHWRDRTVPYKIILIPCVWDTNPEGLGATMIGAINSNAITIDGVSRPANELRFDGFKNARKFTTPGGSKYQGYLKFSQLSGGWTDGKLVCTRYEPLPLEGDQTLPSYTIIASVIQLYDYTRTTFSTIATLCPNCY